MNVWNGEATTRFKPKKMMSIQHVYQCDQLGESRLTAHRDESGRAIRTQSLHWHSEDFRQNFYPFPDNLPMSKEGQKIDDCPDYVLLYFRKARIN
jgi:hypothetical protein